MCSEVLASKPSKQQVRKDKQHAMPHVLSHELMLLLQLLSAFRTVQWLLHRAAAQEEQPHILWQIGRSRCGRYSV